MRRLGSNESAKLVPNLDALDYFLSMQCPSPDRSLDPYHSAPWRTTSFDGRRRDARLELGLIQESRETHMTLDIPAYDCCDFSIWFVMVSTITFLLSFPLVPWLLPARCVVVPPPPLNVVFVIMYIVMLVAWGAVCLGTMQGFLV